MKARVFGKTLALTMCLAAALAVLSAGGCKGEKTDEGESAKPAEAAQYVNVRCPIMGTQLDLANVPEALARVYKGKKVAFCCAGCPAAWDKLTDEQKDAKLAAVLPAGTKP